MTRRTVSPFLRPVGIAVAYAIAAGLALTTTRFGGGVAYLWIANALVVAQLSLLAPRRWPPILIATGVAATLSVATLGLGLVAAVPMAAIHVAESAGAAALLRHLGGRGHRGDSVQQLAALVIAACCACAGSAVAAAIVIGGATGTSFHNNAVTWFTGHALGIVAFGPIARLTLSGEIGRWLRASTRSERHEALGLLALVATVATLVFSQTRLPLLFLPILPVMLATFRLGAIGASASIILIAVFGGWMTVSGSGPVDLVADTLGARVQFFQFYLAVTMLTALPVAADLMRRRRLFDELRDSEARYRLLTDNSTDIVMNLDAGGHIRFVSPSIAQLGGYQPEALNGTEATLLVAERHRERVTLAHRRALADPRATVTVEYRGLLHGGGERWFETHTRAVLDDAGAVTGVVSAVRDIHDRKTIEAELSHAATTDPLTGLANRRAFRTELERRVEALSRGGRPSCVAIFDVDHFKSVNDRYGHEAGDRVLEAFAGLAKRSVRDGDLVARLGGEEFGIILSGAEPDQAQAVCDRLRVAVGAAPVRAGDHAVRVTVSAGIAAIDGSRGLDEVLRAADIALYRAKNDGRNRLHLAA